MGAPADFPGLVKGPDVEGDDLALHSGDFRFRPDFQAHGGGGDVFDIQGGANGGLAVRQSLRDGLAGGALHQGYHAGGGVNQQIAGAHFLGGVLPLGQGQGLALHANGNFHVYHDLST